MKRMKKVFAMLLAFAMVMGMSLTTFAYESININVAGAGDDATFAKLQLIEADSEKETGWDFCTTDIAKDYTSAFGLADGDTQKAIWMLIGNKDKTAVLPAGVKAALDSQIADALANVKAGHTFANHTKPISADAAGVYYIDGVEAGFTYGPMAAYVSFEYSENGVPTNLSCAGVTAKKVPTTLSKDAELKDVKDEVTEINRTETYSVKSTVPFIPTTDTDREYWAKDYMQGAEYVVLKDGKHAGEVAVTVKIGGQYNEKFYATVSATTVGTSFALDLSEIIDKDNTYANQDITLEYDVVVKDVQVHNDVEMGTKTNASKFGKANEDLYTGQITLTKTDATTGKELANATFVVHKEVKGVKYYATFDSELKLTGWVSEYLEEDGTVKDTCKATTGVDGKVIVKGFDLGTYSFKEVEAPEGYSINTTDVSATIELEGAEATSILFAETSMSDTKLSALPSTGGIGTAVFTIGGCVIMIAAAYFFFVNRKRES